MVNKQLMKQIMPKEIKLTQLGKVGTDSLVIPNYSGIKKTISEGHNLTTDDLTEGEINIYSQWTTSGTKIYYNSGNVGINQNNPGYDFDVSGDINYTGTLYENGSALSVTGLWSTGTGGIYYSSGNVGIGTTAPTEKLDVNGNINIADGSYYKYDGQNALRLAKGTDTFYANTFVGLSAGNVSAQRQTALGYQAGKLNTGTYQTAVGFYAGYSNTGAQQTAVGYNAGLSNTGAQQTAVGFNAGNSNIGIYQTAIGINAGYSNSGDRVTGVGYYATYNNTANDVVALGYQAGKNNALANQFIVKQANVNSVPLIQGDFLTGNVGIGTTAPTSKLHIVGIPIYANNAAAITGGLTVGAFYRTGADPDPLCIVH